MVDAGNETKFPVKHYSMSMNMSAKIACGKCSKMGEVLDRLSLWVGKISSVRAQNFSRKLIRSNTCATEH